MGKVITRFLARLPILALALVSGASNLVADEIVFRTAIVEARLGQQTYSFTLQVPMQMEQKTSDLFIRYDGTGGEEGLILLEVMEIGDSMNSQLQEFYGNLKGFEEERTPFSVILTNSGISTTLGPYHIEGDRDSTTIANIYMRMDEDTGCHHCVVVISALYESRIRDFMGQAVPMMARSVNPTAAIELEAAVASGNGWSSTADLEATESAADAQRKDEACKRWRRAGLAERSCYPTASQ